MKFMNYLKKKIVHRTGAAAELFYRDFLFLYKLQLIFSQLSKWIEFLSNVSTMKLLAQYDIPNKYWSRVLNKTT